MDSSWCYQFTVFTPTFNRAHTLSRVYECLKRQTFRDFEWLIVDDGSTDGTYELVEYWKKEALFPIRYFYQQNSGKHVAINRGVALAEGEFFLIVDSDDWLLSDALEKLKCYWDKIPERLKPKVAGVIGLDQDPGGTLIGTPYPADVLVSDNIEIYYNLGVKGDKSGFYRTAVLREFPFPVFEGEKFVTEATVWNRIAMRYKCVYVNAFVAVRDYQPGGLSNRAWQHSMKAPKGMRLYFWEILAMKRSMPLILLFRRTVSFVRFSFHCRVDPFSQLRRIRLEVPQRLFIWMFALLPGYLLFRFDQMKLSAIKEKGE